MNPTCETIHGTAVAVERDAVLLTGPSGSGKSDLALRFLTQGQWPGVVPDDACGIISGRRALVADDQVVISLEDGIAIARPPDALKGLIEIRGVGIVPVPTIEAARLRLIVALSAKGDEPRMPPDPLPTRSICGLDLPVLTLWSFAVSAPIKLGVALSRCLRDERGS